MDSSKTPPAKPGRRLTAMARGDKATVDALSAAGMRSPFDLARLPLHVLQGMPALRGIANLEQLHREAVPAAVVMARGLREKRLSGAVRTGMAHRTGIQSLVDGPTYEGQFHEPWAAFCMPGAPESDEGYFAYLASLYRYVTEVVEQEPGDQASDRILLAKRRPDLADMRLDEKALAAKPAIVAVNEVLEKRISASLKGSGLTVDDALLLKRHPFDLPYERYMAQINYALHRGKKSLGDVIRIADEEYPYFAALGLSSPRAGEALRMDSELGPVQQEILIEALHDASSATEKKVRVNPRTGSRTERMPAEASFLSEYYGVEDIGQLSEIDTFCRATGLRKDDVESLFSIGRYAPAVSPNAPNLAPASPVRFGSSFIHGATGAAITVTTDNNGELHTLRGATYAHFDRAQRIIRLSRWLGLPFDQTDQIVMAAIRAEHAGSGAPPIRMTELTMRAVGLFRRLRRDLGMTAEDFAAMLEGPAVYARGGDVTQFDRIFNRSDLYSTPIVLDGKPFAIAPSELERPKIVRLCSALGIGFDAYLYFARIILQGWYGGDGLPSTLTADTLVWSREVLGAFYRLVRLPAYLGMASVEAVALLQLLASGGSEFIGRLVRPRIVATGESPLTDTLNVIQSLADAVAWCRENALDVLWMHRTLLRMAPPSPTSLVYDELLKQINAGLPAVLVTESHFLELGLPPVTPKEFSGGTPWMAIFGAWINDLGIVDWSDEDVPGEGADDHAERMLKSVQKVLSDLGFGRLDWSQKIVGLILDMRSAQEALVLEALAKRFDIEVGQVTQALIWAGSTGAFLIEQVIEMFAAAATRQGAEPSPDRTDLIAVMEKLDVRAGVIRRLSLSPEAIALYLEKPEVFEPSAIVPGRAPSTRDVSLPLLFAFSRYSHVVKVARQPESSLIEYLRLINDVEIESGNPDEIALIRDDAAVRVAAYTGMSVWNVLESAQRINAQGFVTTVRDLERLMRVGAACSQMNLDAACVFDLAELDATSAVDTFRQCAESSLGTVNRQDDDRGGLTEEVGQSERSTITVSRDVLVAGTVQTSEISVTVRDFFGKARSGVAVKWETSGGKIAPDASKTDSEGVASATLTAGSTLGETEVVASFGLGRRVISPIVLFDCDEGSLQIDVVDDFPDKATAKAGYRDAIHYKVWVHDKNKLAARGRIVRWSASLASPRFTPLNALTDANGYAATSLRSLSPGEATVVATNDAVKEPATFDEVTFTDEPWVSQIEIAPLLALTVPYEARCVVYSIDGAPLKGATVTWKTEEGEAAGLKPSESDENGVARTDFIPTKAGNFRLSAVAKPTGMADTPPSFSGTSQVSAVTCGDYSPKDPQLAIGENEETVDIPLRVVIEPVMPGITVTWTFNSNSYFSTTDADGVAEWIARVDVPEDTTNLLVTASAGSVKLHTFDVDLLKEAVVVTIVPVPGSGIYPSATEDGVFYIGYGYVSTVKVVVASASGLPVRNASVRLMSGFDSSSRPGYIYERTDNWDVDCSPGLDRDLPVDEHGEIEFTLSTLRSKWPRYYPKDTPCISLMATSGTRSSPITRMRPAYFTEKSKVSIYEDFVVRLYTNVYGYIELLDDAKPIGGIGALLLEDKLECASVYANNVAWVVPMSDFVTPSGSIELAPIAGDGNPVVLRFVGDNEALEKISVNVLPGAPPGDDPWPADNGDNSSSALSRAAANGELS